jgi:hypothetical protein
MLREQGWIEEEIGVIPSTTVANLKRRKAATAVRTAMRSRRSISWPRRSVATADGRFSGVLGVDVRWATCFALTGGRRI